MVKKRWEDYRKVVVNARRCQPTLLSEKLLIVILESAQRTVIAHLERYWDYSRMAQLLQQISQRCIIAMKNPLLVRVQFMYKSGNLLLIQRI